MKNTIRVMLVDDHDMVRKGLGVFLKAKPDLQLIAEARNGQEAIDQCAIEQPDVILMDLVMPEMDGAAATRIIRQRWPQVQIVALTSFQEKNLVHDVLQAGAIGYLLKNVSIDELATAIRAAHAGQSTLAQEAVQALIQPAAPAAEPPPDYELTAREMEVLSLLVEGLNNPEIAEKLVVSRATVKAHVSHILNKMGVSNRAEAIALALRQEVVE
ncbi:MAG: response regulator transcription factor [Chloroflexota bacterium]|nr:response regulator transcription factor [Anaerolineales bacterium]MCB8968455.1 response regulator transcription factor [Ardenticatenaceae bacterium]